MAQLLYHWDFTSNEYIADASGTKILTARAVGVVPEDVAKEVVEQLFSAGAQQVLDAIRDNR